MNYARGSNIRAREGEKNYILAATEVSHATLHLVVAILSTNLPYDHSVNELASLPLNQVRPKCYSSSNPKSLSL